MHKKRLLLLLFGLFLVSNIGFQACDKRCEDCEIIDETGNLSERGKACNPQFVEKCQNLGKRYAGIECTCVFKR